MKNNTKGVRMGERIEELGGLIIGLVMTSVIIVTFTTVLVQVMV